MANAMCSGLSRSSGEPLYGTAGNYDHWVLVSLPIARWHAKSALQSHGMPPELTSWLGQEGDRGVKISLRVYDDPSVGDGLVKLKLYPAGQETVLKSIVDVTFALERRIGGDETGWTKVTDHEFFICNDPGHDTCCAKFGPPVFEAASRLIVERDLSVKLFRCSHLGGHKFAATGIVFPHGRMYGRIDEKNVSKLFDAVASDAIFSPCYRGSVWDSKETQIATYAAAERGWLEGPLKHVRVNEMVDRDETHRHLHAEVVGAFPFTVELEKKTFTNPSSCGASKGEKARERWIIAGVNGK